MEKNSKVDPKGHIMLSLEQMQNFCGGLRTEMIFNLMLSGTGYFFTRELIEAKRIKHCYNRLIHF